MYDWTILSNVYNSCETSLSIGRKYIDKVCKSLVKISNAEPPKSIFVIFAYKLNPRKQIRNNNEYMKNCTGGNLLFFF
jgi:hypothetical protein